MVKILESQAVLAKSCALNLVHKQVIKDKPL
jgi:hypothetical protein